MRRFSTISLFAAVVLALAGPVGAGRHADATRLIAHAQGNGSATVKASTKGLRGILWLYRIGGTGPARARGTGTCQLGAHGARTTWAAGFSISPNRREQVWAKASGTVCQVRIAVHGTGKILIQLRAS
ncbi:MAG: hypothetical protein ACYDA3_07775 [Gaiellaceae bacterium]